MTFLTIKLGGHLLTFFVMISLVCVLLSNRANTCSTVRWQSSRFWEVTSLSRVTAGPEAVPKGNKKQLKLLQFECLALPTWQCHSQSLHSSRHCVSSEHTSCGYKVVIRRMIWIKISRCPSPQAPEPGREHFSISWSSSMSILPAPYAPIAYRDSINN